MAKNYFRASAGQMRRRGEGPGDKTFRTGVYFFDDEDPEAMRAALAEARGAYPCGRVHVWRRAATVPSSVRELGDMRPPAEVLQPGQVTATRGHSTGLVAA